MEGHYGGGEIRRLHIIYFLSRTGRVEQPHLIRVHHLNRNGVHLRDVKRWLSDLRGKDMPDAFAWSYKRRYKKGYVWQDLLEDDLITPISDNEFVLKGSEIVPTDYYIYTENGGANIEHPKPISEPEKETQTTMEVSPEISESFASARSSVTDNSVKYEEEKSLLNHSEQSTDKEQSGADNSCFVPFATDNNTDDVVGDKISLPCSRISSSPPSARRKSISGGSLFRNLLSCGAAETNDSFLIVRRKNHSGKICKDEKLGGSARVFGTHWSDTQEHRQQHQQNARRSYDGGVNSTKKQNETVAHKAYKPVHGPTCSQCGKSFKPEKLQKHMKSCRGMKAMARSAASTSAGMEPSRRSTHNESAFCSLLTN